MAFLFILGAIIMGGVAYLALSKKSEFKVRVAALGALAVMVATVIVCLVLYFKAVATPKQLVLPGTLPSEMPPQPTSSTPVTMIMMIVFLIALFAVVFFLAMKEQKRVSGKEDPPADGW